MLSGMFKAEYIVYL